MSVEEKDMRITVYNALTGGKMEIPSGKTIRCYICGPTVYDNSHLGHARTYITFDVVRRILEDVLGQTVVYQMNITDIDDKIIARAATNNEDAATVARRCEQSFFADMDALLVRRPTIITRVTDWIPAITDFVGSIEANGFAYTSCGSVYFDTARFTAGGFTYPRMPCQARAGGAKPSLTDVAGMESERNKVDEKRTAADFALWKAAKPGEPVWDSPFGPGRPGWHTECAAMIAGVLVGRYGGVDLHFGGRDLLFPHHANELAQLEAARGDPTATCPIAAFVHSGHLRIDGEVMSKSRMNFRTIADVLRQYTANQLRIFFLQTDYSADINYTPTCLDHAVALEEKLQQFFRNAFTAPESPIPPAFGEPELAILDEIVATNHQIRTFYRDNFNYPAAFRLLMALVDKTKAYATQGTHKTDLVSSVARFVRGHLEALGCQFSSGTATEQNEAAAITVISDFRLQVKELCQKGQLNAAELLTACDRLRDETVPPLGYLIEDTPDGGAITKKISYQEFLVNKEREDALRQEKLERVRRQNEEKERKQEEERRLAEIPAEDMFRDKNVAEYRCYTQFDERGIPTRMLGDTGDEVDVPKARLKRLEKEWDARRRLNEKYRE